MKLKQALALVEKLGFDGAKPMLEGVEIKDDDGNIVELKSLQVEKKDGSEADIRKVVGEEMEKALKPIREQQAAIQADLDTTEERHTVPAQAKRWSGSLKAFTGPEAEYNAYAFGQWAIWSLKGQLAAHGKASSSRGEEWLANHGILEKSSRGYVVKAQSETINSAGGDLVPDQFVPELIRLVESFGVFRANSRVRPMTGDTLQLPRRTGGLTAYFTAEATADSATAITKSSVSTTKHQLVAQKLATYTLESVELVEDASVSIGDFIAQEIATAFAQKEDNCGFLGTGTSTYGGIFGVLPFAGSASIYDAASGHTAYSTLTLADFHGVTGLLPEYARPGAAWYCSRPAFAASMERLAYAGGGNTVDLISGGKNLQFLGYPVRISQVMNTTLTAQASTNVIAFGDLSMGTTFGDRRSMTIGMDASRHFDTDQVAIKGTERFDIACHTFNSTTAAGPMIVLKTAAS